MNEIAHRAAALPTMSDRSISVVRDLETELAKLPQSDIPTHHVIHGGMYARTVKVQAGDIITGVLIKIPTLVIVQGRARVYVGDAILDLDGYTVIPAGQGRKQAFLALSDIIITMIFPTGHGTVEACEDQFTDEANLLVSRRDDAKNFVVITDRG